MVVYFGCGCFVLGWVGGFGVLRVLVFWVCFLVS